MCTDYLIATARRIATLALKSRRRAQIHGFRPHAAYLVKAIPGLTVQGYFVDFDGIEDAEIENAETRKKEKESAA